MGPPSAPNAETTAALSLRPFVHDSRFHVASRSSCIILLRTRRFPMQVRSLGRSSLRVAPLCLGGNVFGWTANESASFAVLDAFVDAGLNFIDTADVYSRWLPGHRGGESETVIG